MRGPAVGAAWLSDAPTEGTRTLMPAGGAFDAKVEARAAGTKWDSVAPITRAEGNRTRLEAASTMVDCARAKSRTVFISL